MARDRQSAVQFCRHAKQVLRWLLQNLVYSKPLQRKPQTRWRGPFGRPDKGENVCLTLFSLIVPLYRIHIVAVSSILVLHVDMTWGRTGGRTPLRLHVLSPCFMFGGTRSGESGVRLLDVRAASLLGHRFDRSAARKSVARVSVHSSPTYLEGTSDSEAHARSKNYVRIKCTEFGHEVECRLLQISRIVPTTCNISPREAIRETCTSMLHLRHLATKFYSPQENGCWGWRWWWTRNSGYTVLSALINSTKYGTFHFRGCWVYFHARNLNWTWSYFGKCVSRTIYVCNWSSTKLPMNVQLLTYVRMLYLWSQTKLI